MSRQAFQVIAAPEEGFKEPRTFNEAVTRKGQLQTEIETLQGELANKNRRDAQGHRLSGDAYNDWRATTIRVLQYKQQELRSLKAWMTTKNGGTKPSEWALLASAHQLLESLPVPADRKPEVELLLDRIEFVVPGAFLQDAATRMG